MSGKTSTLVPSASLVLCVETPIGAVVGMVALGLDALGYLEVDLSEYAFIAFYLPLILHVLDDITNQHPIRDVQVTPDRLDDLFPLNALFRDLMRQYFVDLVSYPIIKLVICVSVITCQAQVQRHTVELSLLR
jgi:hypothetical protein